MSIQLYIADNLGPLGNKLAADLTADNPGVFRGQQVVTQTEGVNNWLRIRFCEVNGINANTRFCRSQDIISEIHALLTGDMRKPLDQDTLRWKLYTLLGEAEFRQRFRPIYLYYEGKSVNRIALADKLADLFDQYQVYRPELIRQWNNTDPTTFQFGADDWQAWLWMQVHQQTGTERPDKTTVVDNLIAALMKQGASAKLLEKFPVLYFFGMAVITPFYMELYKALSEHIRVVFYMLNPAPHQYWLDFESERRISKLIERNNRKGGFPLTAADFPVGNELLHNWGTLLKQSFRILFSEEEVCNTYEIIADTGAIALDGDKQPATLLEQVQREIRENIPVTERQPLNPALLADGTLQIASSYSPVREVEALYNYLIGLIDQKKLHIAPREIMVCTTDINLYAPYIRAVFDNAPYRIPYTIADQSVASGNNLFSTLRQFLQFDTEQFHTEAVLELLESPLVCQRFGIHDKELIRSVLREANIRFGWEGREEDETVYFGWKFGLEKIVTGLCVAGVSRYQSGGFEFEPLDQVEGQSAHRLIPFLHFVKVLKSALDERQELRSMENWVAYIQEVTSNLIIESGSEEDREYARLQRQLGKLLVAAGADNSAIPFEVFAHDFLRFLEEERKTHRFLSGGVTFCSMVPMRSIPFRVLGMLGMDFDKFPRKEARLNFSLIDIANPGCGKPECGYRNIRDNDKHLFLESLLSAKEFLYISYTGNSIKDGVAKPPSAVVDELTDYILGGLTEEDCKMHPKEQFVVRHPLYGFSRRYGRENNLISYLSGAGSASVESLKKTATAEAGKKAAAENEAKEIQLRDILGFYKDPFSWYLNKAHGIYYREEEFLLPETEPFELDKLQAWSIRDYLVKNRLTDLDGIEEIRKQMVEKGLLPLKNSGVTLLENEFLRANDIILQLNRLIGDQSATTVPLEIQLPEFVIKGIIDNVYGDTLVHIGLSSAYYRDSLLAVIKYYVAIAQGHELSLAFVHENLSNSFTIRKGVVSQQEALESVKIFGQALLDGSASCFPFRIDLPNTKSKTLDKILEYTYDQFIQDIQDRMYKEDYQKPDFTVSTPSFSQLWEKGVFTETWYTLYQEEMNRYISLVRKHQPYFN